MIKEYKPRYNVLLKDDKSYPWIAVTNELYPRVFLTRHHVKDGSRYYGPYSNTAVARTVLDLIRELYPIRTCRLPITADYLGPPQRGVYASNIISNGARDAAPARLRPKTTPCKSTASARFCAARLTSCSNICATRWRAYRRNSASRRLRT